LNRELKAQGIANIFSGMIGGLPVTSVIVRSSANINAGARTKASTITHGLVLLLAILAIPTFLKLIPLASLAAILIVVGFKLTKPTLYSSMWKKGWSQFLPFIATVLGVIFTDLLTGVFIGLIVSVFFILKTNFKEAILVVNQDKNYLIRLTKDVSFLNKATLRDRLQNIPQNTSVLIDATQAHFIDNDIRETIEDFVEEAKTKNIQVDLKNVSLSKTEY
jgi:MFS superfamily sulfate permease-like transporter